MSFYWSVLPDAYSIGGGHCNQVEQWLGRLQCATKDEAPNGVRMILSDLRADRPVPGRFIEVEEAYDVAALKQVANVATWREALEDCGHEVVAVDPSVRGCEDDESIARKFARGTPWRMTTRWRRCDTFEMEGCAIGIDGALTDLFMCPTGRPRFARFKNGRGCHFRQSRCALGFDWSAALNDSSSFLGLVAPDRRRTHFDPCFRRALSRLDATERNAAEVLSALRPAPDLADLSTHARRQLDLLHRSFDAVHVRLGDFRTKCDERHGVRTDKFCPPDPATLATASQLLHHHHHHHRRRKYPRPLLVLSDDPDTALRFLQPGAQKTQTPLLTLNASLFPANIDPVKRLIVELDVATHALLFLGVACSTVSQLIIKKRQARKALHGRSSSRVPSDAFFLWP